MRVGLLIDSLVGGGAERVALNFAETLRGMGHEACLFVLRDEIEHDTGSAIVRTLSKTGQLSRLRPLNKTRLAQRLRAEVAAVEADGRAFDFFISNSEDMDRLSTMAGLPRVFIRYRNSMVEFLKSKVGNSRGFKRWQRQLRWTRKFQRTYNHRHIVTVSDALRRELLEEMHLRPASIHTIYNPFDIERLRSLAERPAELPERPYLIYVARFCRRKNQELLLRAYQKANVPQDLVLLGGTTSDVEEAYLASMRALVDELGLAGRVRFAGFHTNPYPWIRGAELFVMPSDSEGLPTVLIESLALGTPVVSTDCPTGPSEILVDDLAPFLSPVGDIDALAANIREALTAYPTIEARHLAPFDARHSLGQYIALAEQLWGRRSGTPASLRRNPQ